jgi:hypothetical protein
VSITALNAEDTMKISLMEFIFQSWRKCVCPLCQGYELTGCPIHSARKEQGAMRQIEEPRVIREVYPSNIWQVVAWRMNKS